MANVKAIVDQVVSVTEAAFKRKDSEVAVGVSVGPWTDGICVQRMMMNLKAVVMPSWEEGGECLCFSVHS